jgi:hypothetical protein
VGLLATSLISSHISYIMSEPRTNFSFQSNKGGREDGDICGCMDRVGFQ